MLAAENRREKQIPRRRPENGRARNDRFEAGREISKLSSRASPPLADEPRDLQSVIESKSRFLAAVQKTAGLGMTGLKQGAKLASCHHEGVRRWRTSRGICSL